MNVLIVNTSTIGSIVRALPVLDYVSQVSPGCEIDWLVDEQYQDILSGTPLIHRLHLAPLRQWQKRPLALSTWRGVMALKRQLRQHPYDLAFDLQGDLASGLLLSLAGVAERVGFDRDNLQEVSNLLFTTRQVPGRLLDQHVTDRFLRLVSVPFGKDFRGLLLTTDIWTSAEDDAVADALMATLGEGFVFLFHQGTSVQTKRWHEGGWAELAKRLLANFDEATVLLAWGTDEEREGALRLAAAIGPGARVLDRYPLKTFAAILKRVDLAVGPDAGPVHMAAAVGTPTVSFYRSSDGRRTAPRGEQHVQIQAPMQCSRCLRAQCDRDLECRESITVEAVFQGVRRLMAPPAAGRP